MQQRLSISDVVALAGDDSSAGRAALLDLIARIIADLDHEGACTHGEMLSEIVATLSVEVETRVRQDFSARVADLDFLPRQVALVLASDTVDVARPVLTRTRSLSDADLIALIDTMSNGHLSAIALRAVISDLVCDALVSKGGDDTIELLAANRGAHLSQSAIRTLVQRARRQTRLAAILAQRSDREPELVKALFATVQTGLQALLTEQIASSQNPPSSSQRRSWRVPPAGVGPLLAEINQHKVGGKIPHTKLLRYLREGNRPLFCIAFSDTLGVSHSLLAEILERQDARSLAALCKTSGIPRQIYTSIGILVFHDGVFKGRLSALGDVFDDLSAAQAAALRGDLMRLHAPNVVPLAAAEQGRTRLSSSGDQASATKPG
jgi:uncharacterized protein (DUF2336 family)